MKSIIVSDSFDPFFNLALENSIFSECIEQATDETMYLWCNSNVVVIGRFQNPWTECAIDKIEKDNVELMRRDTGGGAVFHDTENICFTFTGSVNGSDYRAKNSNLVCRALATLGFDAVPSGRNDILVGGVKISGAAFREKNGKYIHHGTLLIGTDLARLANYLNPDKKKLASKGITSVRSRVTNLKALNPDITVESVIDALLRAVGHKEGINASNVKHINSDALKTDEKLKTEYERLKSWDWRFGNSPAFTHSIAGRFDWGGIEITLNVKNALLDEFNVYSDALDITLVPHVQEVVKSFCGKPYSATELANALKKAGFDDIAQLC